MAKTDKRELILRAAEKIFKDKRFHEVKLDDIAAAAHVGKGTIYLYFKSKEDMFFQLAMDGFDELCILVHAVAESDKLFRDKLIDMCTALSNFFSERRPLLRIIGEAQDVLNKRDSDIRQLLMKNHQKLIKEVNQILDFGREQGDLRDDIDYNVAHFILIGSLQFRDRHNSGEGFSVSIEQIVDVFLNGVILHRKEDS
ncbi:MAG: TetR/AcrR family transcriptional regulator [Kiritimatiellae bacterium]|nr:TetR/AcrR family transcriptional regulator [Kiritimatiellia bacterium]